MFHKFRVGQSVRQLGTTYFGNKNIVIDGLFEVVRLMPDDQTGEPCYRIKSSGCERAARESELVAAS